MKIELIPYLNFAGNAAEALAFYHTVLGGDVEVDTYGSQFPDTPEPMRDKIMHASLKNDMITLMVSDINPDYSAPLSVGNNVYLGLFGSDAERLTTLFHALSEGGTVEMPLEKMFWGDTYGSFEDRFGTHWMVNISSVDPS